MIDIKLTEWNYHHKKVLMRADLNVPLHNGIIHNDFRLKAIVPTLDYILDHQAMVILITHIGRPTSYDESLSTQHLIPWFEQNGYSISHASTIDEIIAAPFSARHILLFENIRFFPQEYTADDLFAKELSRVADYYVNDAFASLHNNHASISILPYEFAPDKRSIGFLVKKELETLNTIKNDTHHPFVFILGGKKIHEKIPLIINLLPQIDTLILLPAVCFSFLYALNKPIGISLVDTTLKIKCLDIIKKAQNNNVTIMLPTDYYYSDCLPIKNLLYQKKEFLENNQIGICIGEKTLMKIKPIIHRAKAILFNGPMGFSNMPESQRTTSTLLQYIACCTAQSYIVGGDTVAAAFASNVADKMTYLSTGGGATLMYLSQNFLPGLAPFININAPLMNGTKP